MKDNNYIFEGTFRTRIKAPSRLEAFDILYGNSRIIEEMDITRITVEEDKNEENEDIIHNGKNRNTTFTW